MTNLRDIRLKIVRALWVTKSEQAGFAGFAGVAHEEFAERACVEHDDDAVFVNVVAVSARNFIDGARTSSVTRSPDIHRKPRLANTTGA
jgi:hypothetical protein